MTTDAFRKKLKAMDELVTTEWLKPKKPKPVPMKRIPRMPGLPVVKRVIKAKTTLQPIPDKYQQLRARDGNNCWLCHEPLGVDATIEHLVALTHGGPSHMSNYVLVHAACNHKLGTLSVAQKVRMREAQL